MVCLDSSFIIDIWKGRKEAVEMKDNLKKRGESFLIPSPVVMELSLGAHLSKHTSIEKQKIEQFLLGNKVLDFDMFSAFRAGEIIAELEKKGQAVESEDVMIAAIALKNNESLITRNIKHFERIKGLNLESY